MGRAVVLWIAVGAAVLAGAVGGYAALDEDRHDIPDVELAAVDRGTIVRTISATGTLNAVGLVQVGSAVSGRVQSLDADFNSTVTRDQTVAQIDPAGFAAKVAEATAQRDVAASGIAAATAKLVRARAEAENARAARQVLKAKALSAQSVAEQARRDHRRAFASGRADFVAVAEREACPVIEANPDTIKQVLHQLILDRARLSDAGAAGRHALLAKDRRPGQPRRTLCRHHPGGDAGLGAFRIPCAGLFELLRPVPRSPDHLAGQGGGGCL